MRRCCFLLIFRSCFFRLMVARFTTSARYQATQDGNVSVKGMAWTLQTHLCRSWTMRFTSYVSPNSTFFPQPHANYRKSTPVRTDIHRAPWDETSFARFCASYVAPLPPHLPLSPPSPVKERSHTPHTLSSAKSTPRSKVLRSTKAEYIHTKSPRVCMWFGLMIKV